MRFYITPHAAMRALQRCISIDDISRCLRYGKRTVHYPAMTWEYTIKVRNPAGKVSVILDRERKIIITVYKSKRHSYKRS